MLFLAGIASGVSQLQLGSELTLQHLTGTQSIYPSNPDWISDDPHYSTGAALADLNCDGWLDIIIADGNDILPGHLNVYYNQGDGTFPTCASWQSEDVAYNGHIDVADVNGDGWRDVAVAYLGTASATGPIARLYINKKGILSSLPLWNASIDGNAFGVDFGDVNNDGRPDLAVATGWPYNPQNYYHNYVYLNIDGSLESTASWSSYDTNQYMGALWVDADHDHWLDLAYTGVGQETQIYRNLGGSLEQNASWTTQDSMLQDGIMLTAGDVTIDGLRDLFVTDNIQLGGSGNFKQYRGKSDGFFEPTASWTAYGGYGSAVALADLNGDDLLDLATGAWWDHTRLFFNEGSKLQETPSWISEGSSVVEKIVFGDVGRIRREQTFVTVFNPDIEQRLFYLPHQPIQHILKVYCDDQLLDPSEYTFSRDLGWITIGKHAVESVAVEYTYSRSLDMVVSNWDADIGNYLYYSQIGGADLSCEGTLQFGKVRRGTTVEDTFTLKNSGSAETTLNWEIKSYPDWGSNWVFSPSEGTNLTPEEGTIEVAVSFETPQKRFREYSGNITVVNTDNPTDFCTIDISLKTSLHRHTSSNLKNLLSKSMVENRNAFSVR